MAIRCTTAAITAAEDGTGAEATIEGARTGTSYDQSCQGIELNSPQAPLVNRSPNLSQLRSATLGVGEAY